MKEEPSCWNDELITKQSDEIISLFKTIHRTFRCKFKKIAQQYGFTAPQLTVIFHLYKTPDITLNELSDHLMLTKSTVSGIVNRLVSQGVVIREIPENNRRIVKLSVSEDFKKNNDIVRMKEHFIAYCISNTIKNMDPTSVEKIIHALESFILLLDEDNCN
ncbi:MarR family winged helix-turn-helix transcriptional regulator [Clostridium kluyveri]|uniref:MarR family transcriptional regulator n=1 Tax=Clostridium kluyveri TaxID=1534 RepID=A0A1L5F4U5_CLOKL|nr:MarR family winged helix-turn-helix transcriptional regulator [Clostridium kluyveri]APM38024.1 MarR family transcriptional regulator [Clostridium kluyveri]UZQ51965.1 MarR family winged helix-turn-helix transcriptional regulator [Clostridium kluyveri]